MLCRYFIRSVLSYLIISISNYCNYHSLRVLRNKNISMTESTLSSIFGLPRTFVDEEDIGAEFFRVRFPSRETPVPKFVD